MKAKNQSGRSMVEMLGVLAIIGVLSVGGIYGYKQAMSRHQANEVIASFRQALLLLANDMSNKEIGNGVQSGDFDVSEGVSVSWTTEDGGFWLSMGPYKINKEVCKILVREVKASWFDEVIPDSVGCGYAYPGLTDNAGSDIWMGMIGCDNDSGSAYDENLDPSVCDGWNSDEGTFAIFT